MHPQKKKFSEFVYQDYVNLYTAEKMAPGKRGRKMKQQAAAATVQVPNLDKEMQGKFTPELESIERNVQATSEVETKSVSKKSKWEPKNWQIVLENIKKMRSSNDAPVDTMGCDKTMEDLRLVDPKVII